MKTLGLVVAFMIFVPLLLVLLFLFPAEFVVSSWQLSRLDAETTGTVLHSEVVHGRKGTTRSQMQYEFQANDRTYTSDRVRPGFFSNGSSESGGGKFASGHPDGTKVQVYYNSRHPEQSALLYGWPTWSIGFSLGVWGMAISYGERAKRSTRRRTLGKAMATTGCLCIVFVREAVTPAHLGPLVCVFVISAIIYSAVAYFKPATQPAEQT